MNKNLKRIGELKRDINELYDRLDAIENEVKLLEDRIINEGE